MKKFTLILSAIVLVLAVGVVYAYADEGMPMAKDMRSIVQDDNITYAAVDNGVTFVGVVDTGIKCFSEEGAAAGGMASKELRAKVQDDSFTYTALDNGVSFSAEIPTLTCSWDRGLGRDLELHNVITIPGGNADDR
jgi:hypothetical protein